MTAKPRLATCALSGCFGCHMSLLDLDERLLQLLKRVELTRSPLHDRGWPADGRVDLVLVEGACASEADVAAAREARARSKVLVAMGECALTGGVPSLRNGIPVSECQETAYRSGPTVVPGSAVPDDPLLPRPLERVRPVHEVVHVDASVPGCPPPAEALWVAVQAVLEGRPVELPLELRRLD